MLFLYPSQIEDDRGMGRGLFTKVGENVGCETRYVLAKDG